MEEKKELRTYEKDTPQYHLYREMHINQTYNFVKDMREKYGKCDKTKMTIHKALSLLDDFVDPSDPDLDVPNSIHAYQTAERIRKKYPDDKEFQIIGLIHDVGKVLFSFGEPSWAVVGDTYVLGCEFPESIVYYDTLKESPEYGKYDEYDYKEYSIELDNCEENYLPDLLNEFDVGNQVNFDELREMGWRGQVECSATIIKISENKQLSSNQYNPNLLKEE